MAKFSNRLSITDTERATEQPDLCPMPDPVDIHIGKVYHENTKSRKKNKETRRPRRKDGNIRKPGSQSASGGLVSWSPYKKEPKSPFTSPFIKGGLKGIEKHDDGCPQTVIPVQTGIQNKTENWIPCRNDSQCLWSLA